MLHNSAIDSLISRPLYFASFIIFRGLYSFFVIFFIHTYLVGTINRFSNTSISSTIGLPEFPGTKYVTHSHRKVENGQ